MKELYTHKIETFLPVIPLNTEKKISMQELWNTPSVSILMETVLLETS